VQVELDLVQVAVAALGRLDPADDPLQTSIWVIEDDLDRLHALGGALGDHAAAADKRCQLRAQGGMQMRDEARGQAAAFVASLIQIALMVVRGGMLVILAGIEPSRIHGDFSIWNPRS